MRIIVCFLLVICCFRTAHSGEWDYGSRMITRTYPVAFAVQNKFGYGQKFWEANKVMYGYLRAGGIFNTSGVVNTGGVVAEFFPISFLGVFAQSDRTKRDVEIPIFDCDAIECDGQVDRQRVGAKFAIAAGPFFVMSRYEEITTSMETDTTKTLFADEQHSIVGSTAGDEVQRLLVTTGIKSGAWKYFGLYLSQEMQINKNRSFMKLLAVSKDTDSFEYVLGAGVFKNMHTSNVGTVLFGIVWKGDKGVTLF